MIENGYALEDSMLKNRIAQIIYERRIKVIVETGINNGGSTAEFGNMVDLVIGVDNDLSCFIPAAKKIEKLGNTSKTVLSVGNSPFVLKALSSILPAETLYFLDAHWDKYCPLLDEIRAIRKGTGVIVIHDILVPGHPELKSFPPDEVNSPHKELDYDYIRVALGEWSPTHRIEYNSSSTAHSRGVGFIFPS